MTDRITRLEKAVEQIIALHTQHGERAAHTIQRMRNVAFAALQDRVLPKATATLSTPAAGAEREAACHDCGREYGDEHGFPDLVVPNDVWAKISPTGNEGGLLCPSCLCHRAHRAGIKAEAVFRSGPFATPEPAERIEGNVIRAPETAGERIEGWCEPSVIASGDSFVIDRHPLMRDAVPCVVILGGLNAGNVLDRDSSLGARDVSVDGDTAGLIHRTEGEKGDEDASTRKGEGQTSAGMSATSDTPDSPATPVDEEDDVLESRWQDIDGWADTLEATARDLDQRFLAVGASSFLRGAAQQLRLLGIEIQRLRAENQALRERRWTDEDMKAAWTASWMRSLWEAGKLDVEPEEPDFTRWLSTASRG